MGKKEEKQLALKLYPQFSWTEMCFKVRVDFLNALTSLNGLRELGKCEKHTKMLTFDCSPQQD